MKLLMLLQGENRPQANTEVRPGHGRQRGRRKREGAARKQLLKDRSTETKPPREKGVMQVNGNAALAHPGAMGKTRRGHGHDPATVWALLSPGLLWGPLWAPSPPPTGAPPPAAWSCRRRKAARRAAGRRRAP